MPVNNQIDKEEHETEFSYFCEQLLIRTFSQVQLYTGSYFELPLIYFLETVTDLDIIRYHRNVCAIKIGSTTPQQFKGTVLVIQSERTHQGYARLYFKNSNRPYIFASSPYERPAIYQMILQRADLIPHSFKSERSSDLFSDSSNECEWLANFEGLSRDLVDAIWCPAWPEEAHEWITRERPNEWPTFSILNKIVNNGCLLVAKPHPDSQFIPNEFRFSFSKAELILIYAWSDRQLYIYYILRLIKSDVVRKCGGKKTTFLTTYHFKTLMFWACEKRAKDFWAGKIESSVKELILVMIEWLMVKQCRNYFIPGNNMFDHLPVSHDFRREIEFLLDSVNLVDEYISNTVPFTEDPMHDVRKEFSVRIPTNLLYATQLRVSLCYIVDLYTPGRQMYVPSNGIEKSRFFRSDIFNLFQCLTIHRRLVLAKDLKQKLNGFPEIENWFQMANTYQIDGFTDVDISPMDTFHSIITKLLKKDIDSSDNIASAKSNTQPAKSSHEKSNCTRRELCYSRTELRQRCLTACLTELFFSIVNAQIPKPSCFHTAAYEANFYWTICGEQRNDMTVKSYKRALEICDRWLSYAGTIQYSLSFMLFFGEKELPIIISNRWSVIFDKYIQVVFGFLSLAKGIISHGFQSNYNRLDASSDFLVHVYPLDLLGYIRYQCRFHLRKYSLLDDSFTDGMHNDISKMLLYTAARISTQ